MRPGTIEQWSVAELNVHADPLLRFRGPASKFDTKPLAIAIRVYGN